MTLLQDTHAFRNLLADCTNSGLSMCWLDAFDSRGDYCHEPISLLKEEYSFVGSDEIQACLFIAELCMYLATLGTASEESEDEYGSLDDYFASGDCTMEDLFLRVLFEVYVRLLRSR